MEKEHKILNCWCAVEKDEKDLSDLGKDNKRESFLDGYKDISGKFVDKILTSKPF